MSIVAPSKEQSKRSAADIFTAFEYQWNYFILMLLKEVDEEVTISFEYHDDVDVQSEDKIKLYQIKHSIRKNKKKETINLSDRDVDLWKTISIWMKIIDDQPTFLTDSEFHLVTNKAISKNTFVKAIESYKETKSVENLKSAIIAIKESEREKSDIVNSDSQQKKKGLDVSKVIEELLDKTYFTDFCNQIFVSETPGQLKEKIKKIMSNRFGLNCNRVDWVYDQLMTKLRDDSIEYIESGQAVSYTGEIFTERYQSILDIGRQKIHFRTDYSFQDFNGEPRDLLFMKQLFLIGDTKENELDRIAELTTKWLCFNNNLHEYYNNDIFIPDDVNKLTQNVCSAWSSCYRSKHRKITLESTNEELCDAGCNTVDEMRNKEFSLAGNQLEEFLSEGCIYYYSNSATSIIPELPLIGWHRDWKDKFKK